MTTFVPTSEKLYEADVAIPDMSFTFPYVASTGPTPAFTGPPSSSNVPATYAIVGG